jgi:hypothetical protein
MNIWQECKGLEHISSLKTIAWRVVEDQHISSTRKLVTNLEEHEILEDLLESIAKPPLPSSSEFQGLHYLLSTPFRYPPLKHGSRFATRFERSLWYGAEELITSLGEVAFYRLLFFSGSEGDLQACELKLSSYSINIKTNNGICLQNVAFKKYQEYISNKNNYQASQLLGTQMREAGVDAFRYNSARVNDKNNIGVFSPAAFATKVPNGGSFKSWICYIDKMQVEFFREDYMNSERYHFEKKIFLVDGVLPFDYYAG